MMEAGPKTLDVPRTEALLRVLIFVDQSAAVQEELTHTGSGDYVVVVRDFRPPNVYVSFLYALGIVPRIGCHAPAFRYNTTTHNLDEQLESCR